MGTTQGTGRVPRARASRLPPLTPTGSAEAGRPGAPGSGCPKHACGASHDQPSLQPALEVARCWGLNRWQGGVAVAAVERRAQPACGDCAGARRESGTNQARVGCAVSWCLRSGALRRPADRRSEADAGSAGMDVGAAPDRTRRQRRRLDPVEPNSATGIGVEDGTP